ncbi:Origin recognition complex subunit 2 [Lambiella insularis]|nr:Origin recognition complex subunit 2 [Lambiella insularis]
MKRKRVQDGAEAEEAETPTRRRARRTLCEEEQPDEPSETVVVEQQTPSRSTRGRSRRNHEVQITASPDAASKSTTAKTKGKGKEKADCATPTRPEGTPSKVSISIVGNADRSARRKSARNIIERTIGGDLSDDDGLGQEDDLAKQIWDNGEQGEDTDDEEDGEDQSDEPDGEETFHGQVAAIPDNEATPTATPSKRGPGRPKGAQRKRTPTPPADLPPHEHYFFQNRPGKIKTSSNTLSSVSLLTHSDYHALISSHTDPHASSISFLHALHTRAFPQWAFELSQSFSICLYGYGSKRSLVKSFADHLHSHRGPSSPPTTILINGHKPTCSPAQVFSTILCFLTPHPSPPLPGQAPALLSLLLGHLTAHPPPQPIYLLFNSIDAPPLRKAATQSLLAALAAHPSINLLATADQPSFPLLWDISLLSQFNFVFHDATTFVPYDDGKGTGEVGGVVDAVHELIGRKGVGRRGREGVGWVLRSLPENARGVFRVLIGELLALDADPGGRQDELGGDDDDDDGDGMDGFEDTAAEGLGTSDRRVRRKARKQRGSVEETFGVEYKTLYQKAVEEFLCSSEMAFRTLLKEFHDHQMVVSRRDESGVEVLGVPMRLEELEGVLEDLLE